MKQIFLEITLLFATALVIGLVLIPLMIKYSKPLGLVDKPNHRKVHAQVTPVVGGIVIVVSTMLALLLSGTTVKLVQQFPVLLGACFLSFVVGIWDDRKNIRPSYRLLLQLLSATAVAASGIRLSSLYGLFGIEELSIFWQYFFTVTIITGVTNAFNLMDGIDGLAGGLAFINITVLAIIAWYLQQLSIFVLLVAIGGALLAFLKNNIQPAKIFMGDSGSLLMGFLMSAVGIWLIETAKVQSTISVQQIVLIVSGILLIPVFDSLRVYIGRIKRGDSPFKADRTHLHHLMLTMGLNHKKSAFFIYALQLCIVCVGFFLNAYLGLFFCILWMAVIFFMVCYLLQINNGVDKWRKLITKMEN